MRQEKLVKPPEPRYDDVYFKGLKWLNAPEISNSAIMTPDSATPYVDSIVAPIEDYAMGIFYADKQRHDSILEICYKLRQLIKEAN
jgi:hypothetical protein